MRCDTDAALWHLAVTCVCTALDGDGCLMELHGQPSAQECAAVRVKLSTVARAGVAAAARSCCSLLVACRCMQTDLRLLKEKCKRKQAILVRQEEELGARDSALAAAQRDAAALGHGRDSLAAEVGSLQADNAELRAKLEESRQQLQSNEQMIRWLNQQVCLWWQERGAAGLQGLGCYKLWLGFCVGLHCSSQTATSLVTVEIPHVAAQPS